MKQNLQTACDVVQLASL